MGPIERARVIEGGLVCESCVKARTQLPPIVTPMWTRLRQAVTRWN